MCHPIRVLGNGRPKLGSDAGMHRFYHILYTCFLFSVTLCTFVLDTAAANGPKFVQLLMSNFVHVTAQVVSVCSSSNCCM